MIDAIDEAVRTLIRRDALNGSDIEVVFDAPTRDWAARRNSPTVDVYLYDIREDLRRRTNGSADVRDASTGYVIARHPPPRYFKFSYLVTAWTQRPEDEHRLLSAVLACFLRSQRPAPGGPAPEPGRPAPAGGRDRPAAADDRPVSDVWTRPRRRAEAVARPDHHRRPRPGAGRHRDRRRRCWSPGSGWRRRDGAEEAPRGAGRRRARARAGPGRRHRGGDRRERRSAGAHAQDRRPLGAAEPKAP